ncbi:MAG: hypothetical protein KFW21_00585 [Spirochaetota bacterium]|nr:hypothetical protein [Spirochaetota bacterium]
MTQIFLVLLILITSKPYAISNFTKNRRHIDNIINFNYIQKPTEISPSIFKQLPLHEQNLINFAIVEFEKDIELYSSILSPAVKDILQQKLLLEITLSDIIKFENNTPQDFQNIQAIKQVIAEKNQILINLILIENDTNKKLYQELKKKLSTILSQWLYTENNIIDILYDENQIYQLYIQNKYNK